MFKEEEEEKKEEVRMSLAKKKQPANPTPNPLAQLSDEQKKVLMDLREALKKKLVNKGKKEKQKLLS